MASIDEFAIPQGWRITEWIPDSPEKIPDPPGKEFFVVGGILLIGIADENRTECHVAWLDTKGQRWSIHRLPLRLDGHLEGVTDVINEAAQSPYERIVDIQLDKTVIKGNLKFRELGVVDGPVGTFTAEANPRPLGEERIAV